MSARDAVLVGVMVFVVAIGFLIISNVSGNVTDRMLNNTQINSTPSAVTIFTATGEVMDNLDYLVLLVFLGLCLTMIVSGWFIGGYPIFMAVYFIVVVIGVLLGAGLANVWETFTQRPVLIDTLVNFPITNSLMLNLPVYMAVIGFIGLVVMFARPYFMGEAG